MSAIFKIFRVLFYVFLAAFLIGGFVLVGLQAIGVFMGNGDVVTGVNDALAPWVFGAATLCALAAFVLGYRPKARQARKAQAAKEREVEQERKQSRE
ncbi:hypothetical protein [Corynebacterium sp. HMSC071B10]|uniref:hypothetical protein n=1 Tax=Corynebacterium sp. HMSC071B10 TaxID=1739494 RepID=UPI0008A3A365|nr:hypothetical protein [Corynebacterium sp. HMSC071B10]OFP38063.1 hypothetical protein HMPREF2990_01765 [Corynebacterium sp. HMSC071B10]